MPNSERTHCGSSKSRISNGEMIAMRKAGFAIQKIADRAGLPRTTVGSRLRAWGVVPEEKVIFSKLSQSVYDELDRLYWIEQMSTQEIAEHLDMAASKVADRMRRGGIARRSKSEAILLANRRGRRTGPRSKAEAVG